MGRALITTTLITIPTYSERLSRRHCFDKKCQRCLMMSWRHRWHMHTSHVTNSIRQKKLLPWCVIIITSQIILWWHLFNQLTIDRTCMTRVTLLSIWRLNQGSYLLQLMCISVKEKGVKTSLNIDTQIYDRWYALIQWSMLIIVVFTSLTFFPSGYYYYYYWFYWFYVYINYIIILLYIIMYYMWLLLIC